jgi:hypothetical protein
MHNARLTLPRIIRHTLAHCMLVAGLSAEMTTSIRAQGQHPASDDLFADAAWHFELGAHGAIETWNYNNSHENMFAVTGGLSYGLKRNLALVISTPIYYVEQRGANAWLLGATGGIRWRVLGGPRVAMFVEVEAGVSRAEIYTPPRGTRFNYLLFAGAGITTRLSRGTHLLTGIKWVHVSNNGLAGRSRNPDIEAVGPRIAILTRF